MKVNFPPRASRFKTCRSSSSGVALVIVLIMLSLVAVLLVAFLSSSSTELRSAKSYAVGLDGRSLNDSAVNIVISQIQDATAAANTAWASQPGMIRTYNTSGQLVTNYKLYSADVLRTNVFNPISGTSQSKDVPPASTWAASPDQYVDLNKPVTNSGVAHYPIISPAAVASSQSSTTAMDGTSAPIQGCYLDTANTATQTASQPNPVPMPVKWLYVLQDGKLATISSTGVISDATTSAPVTSANPVVGRIAFWTDDETCKVNVNTSAEGTFWDRPRAESPTTTTGYERGFLNYTLPAQDEFQRYPGHPATTSLSTIFPPLAGETSIAYNERIYGIIPRLATGGSMSGTVTVLTNSPPLAPNASRLFGSVDEFLFSAAAPSPTTNPRPANLKAPNTPFTDSDIEKTRFFLTANSRSPEVNLFNKPRITIWPLQANTGTVSDPVNAPNRTAKEKLIAFCSTIGSLPYYFQRYNTFDTTKVRTSGQTYPASLSQTPSSQSPYMDWTLVPRNQSLFAYLQYLTSNPIPGLGGSLSGTTGKYSTAVRDQILTEMMDFIRSNITSATTGTNPSYFYAPGIQSGTLVTGERQVVPLVITPPGGVAYQTKGFGRFETIQQAAIVFYRTDAPILTGAGTAAHKYTQKPPAGTISAGTPATMRAVLLLQPFNPSPGSRSWCENLRYVVTGLTGCKVNNVAMTFPDPGHLLLTGINNTINATAQFGPEFFFRYNSINGGNSYKTVPLAANRPLPFSDTEEQFYTLTSDPIILTSAPNQLTAAASPPSGNNGQFQFTPPTGNITIKIYPGNTNPLNAADLIQTINLNFSTTTAVRLPIPTVITDISSRPGIPPSEPATVYEESDYSRYIDFDARIGLGIGNVYPRQGMNRDDQNDNDPAASGIQHNTSPFIIGANNGDGDTVRNIEARASTASAAKGDLRIFSALTTVPNDYFEGHGMLDTPADNLRFSDTALTSKMIHSIRMYAQDGNWPTSNNHGEYAGYGTPRGKLVDNTGSSSTSSYLSSSSYGKPSLYPIVPRGLTTTQVKLTGLDGSLYPGDWDTGPGKQPDGPYINKPEETNAGNVGGSYSLGSSQYTNLEPEEQGITYSPNRQISSAVSFGSLSTGVDPTRTTAGTTISNGSQASGGIRPWQTLLFCPNPAAGIQHPGMGTPVTVSSTYTANSSPQPPPYKVPPDSAFLDFFTMPIVEPYAISEPFSSAGKINMNYQIVPFTYLTRDTAIRSVLKSDRVMAFPTTDTDITGGSPCYKVAGTSPSEYRYTINSDELTGTLAGFEQRFKTGDIFRSASEICGIYLVPQNKVTATGGAGESLSTAAAGNPTYDTMSTWWNTYKLTGDNVREQPYGYIYPRLTTKSNSYTVHVWTQTLKKAPTTNAAAFVSGQDQITSEYRGSYILQRYLDPNSDSLISTDGTTPTEVNPNSMVGPYKFRVVATKKFAP